VNRPQGVTYLVLEPGDELVRGFLALAGDRAGEDPLPFDRTSKAAAKM